MVVHEFNSVLNKIDREFLKKKQRQYEESISEGNHQKEEIYRSVAVGYLTALKKHNVITEEQFDDIYIRFIGFDNF